MIRMFHSFTDPYIILGLEPGATRKEIKKAYRRLAMQYHPDRNQNDLEAAEKFKQAVWAYETLIRKKKEVFMPDQPYQTRRPFSGIFYEDAHPFTDFFSAMSNYLKGTSKNPPYDSG